MIHDGSRIKDQGSRIMAVGWVAWFSSHPFLKQINVQGQGQGQEARIKDQGSRIGCLVLLPSFSENRSRIKNQESRIKDQGNGLLGSPPFSQNNNALIINCLYKPICLFSSIAAATGTPVPLQLTQFRPGNTMIIWQSIPTSPDLLV